ncbi:VCBS repeat-containing protein [Lysobacter sp. 5GHs7-4]|uniref:FG-GAP repeat domain-containing protein n=1 Tax=Lysobacter sp. 5GHs7-4 TaxID=2904253 RepID=UPI001E2E9472|nr:VCBS repeat-containing protein [Lysobacter sp. 5GHs7-4]UHQ22674.1 VCBS repeat-containing protein [Lysobacter sp. 5GHs7-4]
MRNLLSAAFAAALLTGCPLEQKTDSAESNNADADAEVTPAVRPSIRAPGSTRNGVVRAIGIGPSDTLAISAAPAASPLAITRPAQGDANADGRSDLTWVRLNGFHYDTAHWRMNGATVQQYTGPTRVVWEQTAPVLNADFDGDRRVDQLWFNASDPGRQLVLARQNETGGFEQTYIATVGEGWTPRAAVDLNGDGKSDIVWVDKARGLMAYWLMSGPTVLGSRLYSFDTENYVFLAAGSGDFDGDGRGDLLWYGNDIRGPIYMWRGRTDGHFDQLYVGNQTIEHHLRGTTDLNGDGKSDLIFTAFSRKQFSYWLMNGASVLQRGSIDADMQHYQVATLGDFDGDGKGDVMWSGWSSEGNTEPLYLWRSLGNGTFESRYVAHYDNTIWRVIPNP